MSTDKPTSADGTWVDPADSLGVLAPEPLVTEAHPADQPRYGPRQMLGQGAIGRVFAVRDDHLGRKVALKELKPGPGRAAVRRFLREARVTAQLEHPGIVPVHEAGTWPDGRHYYTMKMVRGRPLSEVMEDAPLPRLDLLDAFIDVCQAMAYAHNRGVVHRDLKPDNIMIGAFGETLVVDWGLARVLGEADDETEESLDMGHDGHQTRAGTVVGTPAYMAPEQARGEEVGPPADVFALGAIAFRMVTGTTPYGHGDAQQLLALAVRGSVTNLDELAPRAPADLRTIIKKALQTEPSTRYSSAAELTADLESWRSGARVAAHTYSTAELARRFIQQYRLPLGALAVGLVGILATASIGTYRIAQQRDAALNSERAARSAERDAVAARKATQQALSSSLAVQAKQASLERRTAHSQALAAAALANGENPVARGVLAGDAAAWHPTLARTLPFGCESLHLLPKGVLCAHSDRVVHYDDDGQELWSFSGTIGRRSVVQGNEWLVATRGEVVALNVNTGVPSARWDLSDITLLAWVEGERVACADRWCFVLQPGEPAEKSFGGGSAFIGLGSERGSHARLSGRVGDSTGRHDMPTGLFSALARPNGWLLGGQDVFVTLPNGELQSTLRGIETYIASLAVEEELGLVAAGMVDGTVVLWNLEKAERLAVLPKHAGVASVAFRDGELITTAGKDTTRVWTLPPTSSRERWKLGEGANRARITDDSVWVMSEDRLHQWSREGAHLGSRLLPHTNLFDHIVTDDRVVVLARGGRVHTMTRSLQPLTTTPPNKDHTRLLRGGDELFVAGEAGIRNIQTGDVSWAYSEKEGGMARFRGDIVAVLHTHTTTWIDLLTGKTVELPNHGADLLLGVASDGLWLSNRTTNQVSKVGLDGTRLQVFEASAPRSAELVELGNDRVAIAYWTSDIEVFDVPSSTLVARLEGHTGRPSLTYDDEHQTLWSSGWDGVVRRWDLSLLDAHAGELTARLRADYGTIVEADLSQFQVR